MPESVIALTFVALGTSLPELVTAITSLVKGHGSLYTASSRHPCTRLVLPRSTGGRGGSSIPSPPW